MKYKDVIVGQRYVLGKFLTHDNKHISNQTATVLSKCSGGSGGHIMVGVDRMSNPFSINGQYTIHLCNIKAVAG